MATNKLFEKHVREKHQVSEFLYFCECGYSSLTARGTGTHKRSCDGNTTVEHQYECKCQLCPFSSQTENGVLVHKSVAHKAEYNKELKEKEKNFKYTEQELLYLARTIRQLKKDKTRDVNKVAGERIGRTTAAIVKIRTKTEYRQAEKQVKEEEEEHKRRELQRKEKVQEKETEGWVWDLRSAQELTGEEEGDNKTMVERSKQTDMNAPVNIK